MKTNKFFASVLALTLTTVGIMPSEGNVPKYSMTAVAENEDDSFFDDNLLILEWAHAGINNYYITRNYIIPDWYKIDLGSPVYKGNDKVCAKFGEGYEPREDAFKMKEFFPSNEFFEEMKKDPFIEYTLFSLDEYKCVATVVNNRYSGGYTDNRVISLSHIFVKKDVNTLKAKWYNVGSYPALDISYNAAYVFTNNHTMTSDKEVGFRVHKNGINKTGSAVDEASAIYTNIPIVIYDDNDNPIGVLCKNGDVNQDKKVDMDDVDLMMDHINGVKPLDDNAFEIADVNGDGVVNIEDANGVTNQINGVKKLENEYKTYSFDIQTIAPVATTTTSTTTTSTTTTTTTTAQITVPKITMPQITTPQVTTPQVTTPQVTTPQVTTPQVTTPQVTTPQVTTPQVTKPQETNPTTKTSNMAGDIDGDGKINAVDASMTLRYYAFNSTNSGEEDYGWTEEQIKAADVNKNGIVDAVDASIILSYYAYISTTYDNIMSLEEYVQKNFEK